MKMEETRKNVRKYYEQKYDVSPDSLFWDIDVSFDGSWMTRGHRSHVGMGAVIEADLGIIVDIEVLCNMCTTCTAQKKK